MTKSQPTLASRVAPLKPFAEKIATLRYPTKRLFSSLARASFTKAFEFVELAAKKGPEEAFFLAPSLRGITEDIILLRFISGFPDNLRQKVLSNMAHLMAAKALGDQERFFGTFRPFQPVLPAAAMKMQEHRDELRTFWRTNGWPHLKKDMPPVRQIAEKTDSGVLHVVYDFIYRLSSGIVHFNPQVLLRSGWGDIPSEATFSSKNMGNYYLQMSRVYGCYLLCLYFEFFGRILRPSHEEKAHVTSLREHLLEEFRWPEMITFEEMNVSVPQPSFWPTALLARIHDRMMRDGFISGARQVINLEQNTKNNSL